MYLSLTYGVKPYNYLSVFFSSEPLPFYQKIIVGAGAGTLATPEVLCVFMILFCVTGNFVILG